MDMKTLESAAVLAVLAFLDEEKNHFVHPVVDRRMPGAWSVAGRMERMMSLNNNCLRRAGG